MAWHLQLPVAIDADKQRAVVLRVRDRTRVCGLSWARVVGDPGRRTKPVTGTATVLFKQNTKQYKNSTETKFGELTAAKVTSLQVSAQ